jgi:hypothetical protein
MYALILEKGSSNGPSANVGLSFPSYSNLLNISYKIIELLLDECLPSVQSFFLKIPEVK